MGLLGKILKTTINLTTLPLDIVKDVVTLGGTLEDKDKSYTAKKMNRLGDNLEEIMDEFDNL